MRLLLVVCLAIFVSACSGVGILATNDPYEKLEVAQVLYLTSGRAMRAREQLDQAIEIFKAKNDKVGLGMAYAHYGYLARMGGATDAITIRPDPNMTVRPSDANLALADKYWVQAVDLFNETNRPDYASGVYLAMAKSGEIRGDKESTCTYVGRAYVAGQQVAAERTNASTASSAKKYEADIGTKEFFDFLADMKRKNGCA